jgi:hypothetical protein
MFPSLCLPLIIAGIRSRYKRAGTAETVATDLVPTSNSRTIVFRLSQISNFGTDPKFHKKFFFAYDHLVMLLYAEPNR